MLKNDLAPVSRLDHESLGRLYERRVAELSLIRRLSNAITLDLGIEESAGNLLDIVIDELDITNASIMLYDETSDRLCLSSVKGIFDEEARVLSKKADESRVYGQGSSPRPGEGIAGIVFRDSTPIFVEDVEKDSRFSRYQDQKVLVGSLMCLPLIVRGNTIGIINLSHIRRNAIRAEECHGLVIVANQIAMMLDSVVNYQQQKLAYQELEAQVSDRTAHLVEANRELKKTRSSLVKAERLKALGQMASGVAHDFNNILTGILGKTQVLMRRYSDADSLYMLESVELAALDGASIVKRIQDFSRKEGMQEFKTLDLNDIVRDTVKLTDTIADRRKQMKSRCLSIDTRLGPPCLVEGDAPELREVLTNLIINAIDATSEGGAITITTSQAGGEAFLTVADSGEGIDAEKLDSVFEPFFTTKGPSHSGLGLSVIFGIVKNHSGIIEVKSDKGVGTTFTICLPGTERVQDVVNEPLVSYSSDSVKILVIDDEPAVLEAIVIMLEELGHTVISASNGTDGLVCFQNNEVDVVFTDLGMPDLSGWEVTSRIKRIRPDIPVVLTTGWAREIDPEEARAKGADHVLGKPFALDKLDEILHLMSPTIIH